MSHPDEDYIRASVRRRVGKAVLARLQRIAEAQDAQERMQARWAGRLTAFFLVAALAFLLWLALQTMH